jgi:hypothetical protein
MKRNLLISLLLIITVFSCDQEDVSDNQSGNFVKYYTNYPEFTAADVTKTGSGYAILGTAYTYAVGSELCLLRTDEFGNTVDSARFYGQGVINTQPYDEQAYCLQVMADGGFAILGSSKNPLTLKLEVFFIRTDSKGDILWSRTIKESGDVEAKHFEMNSQGSFFMTGYCEVIDLGKQIWWFALDKDGNNLLPKARTHGFAYDDEGTHVQILQDGRLIITGRTIFTSGTVFSQAFVLRTDIDLKSDIFCPIFSSGINEEGNSIRALDNDHCLILCTTTSASGSVISLKQVSLPGLNVDWEKTYGSSGNDIGQSMIKDGNSIYILGTTRTTGTNTAISLITTDASGNQTERSDYGMSSGLSAASFEQTADGGFIILGTNNYSENNISIALIKTETNTIF